MKNFTLKLAVVCLVISTLVVGFLSISFPELVNEQNVKQLSKLILQVNFTNVFSNFFDSINSIWVGVDFVSELIKWLTGG